MLRFPARTQRPKTLAVILQNHCYQTKTLTKMKKYFYILGLLLIIFGCLSGMILDALTFIIAIIGIVLVLIPNQKLWIKILTVIVIPPIAIYVPLIFLFSNS